MNKLRLASALISCCLILPASAAETLQRKSGLWELKTQISGMPAGMPGQGPIQMCVDQASDNIMEDRSARPGKADCPVMDIKPGIGKMTVHAVCRHDGTTMTTDAVITGDFNKSYRSESVSRFQPPQNGMKEMKMTQEARWLGPCQPGQKPGDVIMPGMGKLNMQEMMNDPKLRELMQRQQQAR